MRLKDRFFVVISLIVCSIASLALVYSASIPHFEDTVEVVETSNLPTQPEPTTKSIPVSEEEPSVSQVMIQEEPLYQVADLDLSFEVQQTVFEQCAEYDIDPKIIFAQIFVESTCRADTIGDQGNSFGLMQIQPKWHSARMEELGVTNLLDPIQNIRVGTHYMNELINRYDGSIEKALVAYNQGSYKGTITTYAKNVLSKAEELTISPILRSC